MGRFQRKKNDDNKFEESAGRLQGENHPEYTVKNTLFFYFAIVQYCTVNVSKYIQ